MRLKKTLFAMVTAVAAASMVLPNVNAGVTLTDTHRRFINKRTVRTDHAAQIAQHNQVANQKNLSHNGVQKPLANHAQLAATQLEMDRVTSPGYRPIEVTSEMIHQHINQGSNKSGRFSPDVLAHMETMGKEGSLKLTQKQLDVMNIARDGSTETADQRMVRLNESYKNRANKGVARDGGALPSAEIPDGSAMSTLGFVGLSAQNAGDNSSFLLGDLDGQNKLDRDIDNIFGGNPGLLPRTAIDRKAVVTQGTLLPDEIYTDMAISGHNTANGFTDFNVFYTGTNKGFLTVEADSACDGDLLADRALTVVALTTLGFSPRAAITGISVETDTEFDGDFASDELVWFSVFDPDFGRPSNATSALLFMFDNNGDDIPDTPALYSFAFGLISSAGVANDSFGNVYWSLHDNVVGIILSAFDTDEDRFPETGFNLYNFDGANATNLDLFEAANAVDMAIDRNDTLYQEVPGSDNPFINVATGLPNHVATYRDRCGSSDPLTGFPDLGVAGLFPRPDFIADDTVHFFAADSTTGLPTTQGGGTTTPAPLIIPEMTFDFSGYSGLATDYDDNVYVAVGAEPAGLTNQSPAFGFILQIPDHDCNGVGDAIDRDGSATTVKNGVDEFGQVTDYLWMEAPSVPATRTPIGIDGIDFGPLLSLSRLGLQLGDDDAIGFSFDDMDGDLFFGHTGGPNAVAGGVSDLLRTTRCDNVGSNPNGGPVGFEFLFCNIAWTGFRLGSNGSIWFRNSTLSISNDPVASDFSPTVPEFLSGPPRLSPAYTDFTPNGGGQFSVNRLGFAATDAFIIQYIDYPQFSLGGVIPGFGPLNINSFDVTMYDDSDSWDDVNAEFGPELEPGTGLCARNPESAAVPAPRLHCEDTTNLNNAVNNDNDGSNAYISRVLTANGSHPTAYNGRLIDRNGDNDRTDENLSEAVQEGVGRTLPEQGPFSFRYHIMELSGDPDVGGNDIGGGVVIVGFSTGNQPGSVPPGLCETNLSQSIPAADAPFMPLQLGMGTEPSLYELFNDGILGGIDPVTGQVIPGTVDFDLIDIDPACITRPGRFLDQTFANCLNFKGSNMPVGLFCQSVTIADNSPNDDPFVGPTTFQVTGFSFPMPTSGINSICPNAGGGTVNLTRNGKSVTYTVMFLFDEDGDGVVDSMFTFGDPDVVVVNENCILATVDFSDEIALCGGAVSIKVQAVITPADDNKYFELQQLDADEALEVAPVTLTCAGPTNLIGFRAPIVTSIAPSEIPCDAAPLDVQINGLCFFGDITQAFLTTNPDGTGTRIDLTAITNPNTGTVNGVIAVNTLAPGVVYYVFVVRADGARSTSFPTPLGQTVTFHCNPNQPPTPGPVIASCEVNRRSGGVFVLTVLSTSANPFIPNDTIVLLNGQPCRKNKYPQRFRQSDGTTLGINCSGGIKRLLPATVTTRNADGLVSQNSVVCDF